MKNPLSRRKHVYYQVREHMRKQPSLVCVIGDSHLNRTERIFQKLVNEGETYFNVFRGATAQRFNHYILPKLHEDKPDVVLLHIGSNDINNHTKDKINTEKITEGITNTGESCIDLGVKEVIISSI